MNSFVLDFVSRQKLGGASYSFFIKRQLPVPPPRLFNMPAMWYPSATVDDWVGPRVLELTYTAWDLEPFAKDCGWSGPPFRWNEERRFLLRCELDAAFFHLYLPAAAGGQWKRAVVAEGAAHDESLEDFTRLKANFPTPRDAVTYILDTFPIVRRRDEEKYDGKFRTKLVILEIYGAMAEAIRSGVPYQTRLDPPPADPRCCHPKLKVGILAFGSLIKDPGTEIKAKIVMRIKTQTPFLVEFGRYSGVTRGGAPTLVPHESGSPVSAEILVLEDSVTIAEARNMLYRREIRKPGSGEEYAEGTSANSVLVREITDSPWVSMVLYTDFRKEGKIEHPAAEDLANHAIQSAKKAAEGKDGITYLRDAIASGIKTPITPAYQTEVLRQTRAQSLDEALENAKTQ